MAKPLHYTKIPAKALPDGVKVGEDGARGIGIKPAPAQREIWRLHEAQRAPRCEGFRPLHESVVVEVVRRTGKTESLFALAVGRCRARPGYSVIYCAQSGIKSRARFLALVRRMGRHSPGDWKAYRARGEEAINFDNGSVIYFYPPKAESFRGDAIDWVIFDEAQEVDEEDAADLIGSVLPVFDTMPGAQLTVAGTAGKRRAGLLWDALEKGRSGGWAILEYSAGEDPDEVDPSDEKVWLRSHPGPATNPTREGVLQLLRKRQPEMSAEMFNREYLGLWPKTGAMLSAFSIEVWEAAGGPHVDRGRRIGLAFDVTPSRDAASIACAWRDADGIGHLEVLEARPGTDWLVRQLLEWSLKLRSPIGYDAATGSGVLDFADTLARAKPRYGLQGLTTANYVAACAQLASDIIDGRARHASQTDLNDAVEVAAKRKIGDAGWGWGRSVSAGNISPLVAATVALRVFDDLPAQRSGIMAAQSA